MTNECRMGDARFVAVLPVDDDTDLEETYYVDDEGHIKGLEGRWPVPKGSSPHYLCVNCRLVTGYFQDIIWHLSVVQGIGAE